MECSHAQVVSSVLPNRRTPDRLMGSKAGSTPQGVTTNLQRARETGRFWRGFMLRESVDSKHSRRIPIIDLKNRRTFTLFTTSYTLLVIWLNVRRNLPQSSNFWLNVRSSNELSRLYCPGSGRYEAMSGNLYCVFSTEKYSVIRKRGRQVEVMSNIHPKFFGVNVRRYGPQPSIFIRSFSQITSYDRPTARNAI